MGRLFSLKIRFRDMEAARLESMTRDGNTRIHKQAREKKPMKVIVPLDKQAGLTSKVCGHFGSAPFYAVADMDANTFEIIPNSSNHHDHGSCTPAGFFSGLGISALLCNGIGAGAAAKLQSMGIAVYRAEMAPTLEESLRRFSTGILKKMTPQQTCQGHGCH